MNQKGEAPGQYRPPIIVGKGFTVKARAMPLDDFSTLDPAAPSALRVTVVTKRRIATDVATTLTETTFHKRLAQAWQIVKAGKPLPATPP